MVYTSSPISQFRFDPVCQNGSSFTIRLNHKETGTMSRLVLSIIFACFLLVGADVHSGEDQYGPVSMDPPNPDLVYLPVLDDGQDRYNLPP